jgi:hypothetical protein
VNLPPHPSRKPVPRRLAPRVRIPWTWLEWFVVSQTVLPALLFVPGVSMARTPVRVAAYLVAPVAWFMIAWRGGTPGAVSGKSFPARPWLLGCIAWLILSIFHPNVYSLLTACAQVALYVAVLSPAFWAPQALGEPRQLGRVLGLLFLCNALSAAVGVAQVFRPDTFNPPVIKAMSNQFGGVDLMYETADGRKIVRPCGLTDTPGSASAAGAVAALLGLCLALRPMAMWKRIGAALLAFVGMAVIYYAQVRQALVMLMISIVVLCSLFLYQRRFAQATQLAIGAVITVAGALAWVARSVGSQVVERFAQLLAGDPGSFFHKTRGVYVEDALFRVLPEYPLGFGMGWWGMIYGSFGDTGRISPVWVEVMVPAWIYDGGLPLLILYVSAVAVALFDTTRVALTCPDRDVAFWAAVVVALNLSIVATCMSFVTFLAPVGLQFWLLSAIVHAADRQVRQSTGANAESAAGPRRSGFEGHRAAGR